MRELSSVEYWKEYDERKHQTRRGRNFFCFHGEFEKKVLVSGESVSVRMKGKFGDADECIGTQLPAVVLCVTCGRISLSRKRKYEKGDAEQ